MKRIISSLVETNSAEDYFQHQLNEKAIPKTPKAVFLWLQKNKFAINTFEKLLRVLNNFVCWLWDVSGGFQNNFKLAEFDDACKTFIASDWYGSFLKESHYLIPTLKPYTSTRVRDQIEHLPLASNMYRNSQAVSYLNPSLAQCCLTSLF